MFSGLSTLCDLLVVCVHRRVSTGSTIKYFRVPQFGTFNSRLPSSYDRMSDDPTSPTIITLPYYPSFASQFIHPCQLYETSINRRKYLLQKEKSGAHEGRIFVGRK